MQNINTANDITCDALHVHLYEHKKESDAAWKSDDIIGTIARCPS